MRFFITGDTWFDDYSFLKEKLDALTAKAHEVEVVVACAYGKLFSLNPEEFPLAAKWCHSRRFNLLRCHCDHEKYPDKDKAFAIRDKEIESLMDAAVVFWDGDKGATQATIKWLEKLQTQIRIVRYES